MHPLHLLIAFPLFSLLWVSTTSLNHSLTFHDFNVEAAIKATRSTLKKAHEPKKFNEEPKWKLPLLHRGHLLHGKNSKNKTARSYSRAFKARMSRDSKRVFSLLRKIEGYAKEEFSDMDEFGFGSDVVSGTDQGSGEYFVRIGVGSPPSSQYMVIDSGSDIVWVQCQPCSRCYQQSDPVFDPNLSTSFSGASCSSQACNRLDNGGCHAGRCRYEVLYGDGSYTKGNLAFETLTFGSVQIQNVAIGCGHMNQGMFVGAAGLLGLGGGSMSFIGQLGGQTGGAFTYCLSSRGSGSTGSLQFGLENLPVGAVWVPLVRNPQNPSFYYIAVSGIGVAGERVSLPDNIFDLSEFGSGGFVMDTGTAVTRLPTEAYVALRDEFVARTLELPPAAAVSIFDTCYNLSGLGSVRVPTVSFYFAGGPVLTIPAANFLIPVDDMGVFCFAFAPSPSGLSILGNVQQEGIQISINGGNGFVGFGPNVC